MFRYLSHYQESLLNVLSRDERAKLILSKKLQQTAAGNIAAKEASVSDRCADIAVRTDCPSSRAAVLRALASTLTREELDTLIRSAERRASRDASFVDLIASRSADRVTSWQNRLVPEGRRPHPPLKRNEGVSTRLNAGGVGTKMFSSLLSSARSEVETGIVSQRASYSSRVHFEQVRTLYFIDICLDLSPLCSVRNNHCCRR